MTSDYFSLSIQVFESAKYQASDFEIRNLAVNMKLLDERGLSKLNSRLLDSKEKILDTLAEHNFATKLLLRHNKKTVISYEPNEGLRRPPDFKVNLGGKTYWVQMKKLSRLEREHRQRKIVNKIVDGVKSIQVGMFFGCVLSEHFSDNDLPDLVDFITAYALNPQEGKEYYFAGEDKPKAIVDFWYPKRIKLSSLTLGVSGDADMVNITGLVRKQMLGSLINAAGAFDWDTDPNTINFIVVDIDNYEDIDVCNAIFGGEFDRLSLNSSKHTWSREEDGFFLLPQYCKKVAGVIGLRRKSDSPVTDYFALLHINEVFKDLLNDFDDFLSFDKIIYRNMRRPMGKGDFELWT